jgi:hypothetical protein
VKFNRYDYLPYLCLFNLISAKYFELILSKCWCMALRGKVFDGMGEASIAWVSLLPELPELTKSLPSSFNVQLCLPSFACLFDASSHSFNIIVLDLSLNFS